MNDLSDDARQLIETASDADGPSDTRIDAIGAELFRKLGAGAVALSGVKLAAAATPAVPLLKAGATGIATYFLIGVTAGVGVAVTSAAFERYYPNSPTASQAAPLPAEPASVPSTARAGAVASALPSGVDEATPAPAPAERAREPKAQPEPVRSQESSLSAEVASLREIQAFLAAGDGPRAVAASDRYLAEQRTGTLRDEHLAARVLALCMVGDPARARAVARLFVATSAASPLLPRLAHSCVADVIGKRSE
jgi:hypothetical protein